MAESDAISLTTHTTEVNLSLAKENKAPIVNVSTNDTKDKQVIDRLDKESQVEADKARLAEESNLNAFQRYCPMDTSDSLEWDATEAGALAIILCPSPYHGNVYRACFSSGVWDEPDYTECRLGQLKELQNLVSEH